MSEKNILFCSNDYSANAFKDPVMENATARRNVQNHKIPSANFTVNKMKNFKTRESFL